LGAGFLDSHSGRILVTEPGLQSGARHKLPRAFHRLDAAKQQPFFNNLAYGTALAGSGFLECLVQRIIQGDGQSAHSISPVMRHKSTIAQYHQSAHQVLQFRKARDSYPNSSSHPLPGTLVTYRYRELTKSGMPRFPRYLRVRDSL